MKTGRTGLANSDQKERNAPRRVPAVSRAMQLLSLVAQSPRPLTLTEISRELGLAKSTVHALCTTSVEEGYLRRDGNNFRPGPMGVLLGRGFRSSSRVLSDFLSILQTLPLGLRQAVTLSTLVGKKVMYLGARSSCPSLELDFSEGMLSPAYLEASGKVLLAWREDVEELFGGKPLVRLTNRGPADLDGLLTELAQVRARGWSIDDGGVRPGIISFAAPVFDRHRAPTAAVAICLSKAQVARCDEAPQRQVVELGRHLTRRVGGVAPGAVELLEAHQSLKGLVRVA